MITKLQIPLPRLNSHFHEEKYLCAKAGMTTRMQPAKAKQR
jgi:hypothetical protein